MITDEQTDYFKQYGITCEERSDYGYTLIFDRTHCLWSDSRRVDHHITVPYNDLARLQVFVDALILALSIERPNHVFFKLGRCQPNISNRLEGNF